jgi:arylsulfatase A-like enzyme
MMDLFRGGFDPTLATLAGALRQAGYSTHAIVSAPYLHPAFGFPKGFDSYDASIMETLHHANRAITSPAILQRARQVMDRVGQRPLFLFLHFWDVHYDYLPPLADLEAVHPKVANLPLDLNAVPHPHTGTAHPSLVPLALAAQPLDGGLYMAQRLRRLAPRFPDAQRYIQLLSHLYDGELRQVDRHLGVLFDELRRRGRWDETVVVVTSDHGEAFLEHGTLGHTHNAVHQEGLQIPLLVRAPHRIRPERRHVPSTTVDVPATILALLDLPSLSGSPGQSLLSARRRRLALGHDGSFGNVFAAHEDLRLMVWGPFGPDQLFDVARDPEELVDVGEQLITARRELRRNLAEYLLRQGRGLHVALVGSASATPWEITLRADQSLKPAFVYGPPDAGRLRYDDQGQTLKLQAWPLADEIVAMTVLVPDHVDVECTARRLGGTTPTETVRVGHDGPMRRALVDETWQLEPGTLPFQFGARPGLVHLWQTSAGRRRVPITPPTDTFDQLRALGYLTEGENTVD